MNSSTVVLETVLHVDDDPVSPLCSYGRTWILSIHQHDLAFATTPIWIRYRGVRYIKVILKLSASFTIDLWRVNLPRQWYHLVALLRQSR